jgi:4-amino-4-deoxy-L-arabinose transferase-like glycosyltransferase
VRKLSIKFEAFVRRYDKVFVAVLVSVVVLSGILYSMPLGNNLRYSDERVYYTFATDIVNKHQYSLDSENPTAYRPPGYPLILSFFMLLGADVIHFRILNFVSLGLCIYLLYKILKEQSSPSVGLLGALIVVFYPVLFYTAGTLYPQTIGSFLFLLIIYLITGNRKSHGTLILSGLLFGSLMLIIPTFVLILFVVCVWLLFFERSIETKSYNNYCCCVLTSGIWCVRNCVVFKSFVFISSNSGLMLLRGNSENATPNVGPGVDITKYEAEAAQLQLNS